VLIAVRGREVMVTVYLSDIEILEITNFGRDQIVRVESNRPNISDLERELHLKFITSCSSVVTAFRTREEVARSTLRFRE
jgi:hypothetical protein